MKVDVKRQVEREVERQVARQVEREVARDVEREVNYITSALILLLTACHIGHHPQGSSL